MRIFLTGGTGFIGSHFINQAHAAGHDILALRRPNGSSPRIPLLKQPVWLERNMQEIQSSDLDGCSVIVHLAAHSANVPYDTLENCIQHNVLSPLQMLRVAVSAGIRRMIAAGTCFEYGSASDRYEEIPTDAPLEPTSSYPASKAAACVAFNAFAIENHLELLTLRIFQVYGEGEQESRFWPSLRRAALAGDDFPMSPGLQVRDFINVTDVAAGFLNAVTRSDLLPGKPLIENLGSGQPMPLIDFARQEWSRFGATGSLDAGALPMRPNEVMRIIPAMNHSTSIA
jgi:nucleoside-diphosphate-sugar epimerase